MSLPIQNSNLILLNKITKEDKNQHHINIPSLRILGRCTVEFGSGSETLHGTKPQLLMNPRTSVPIRVAGDIDEYRTKFL